MTAWWSSFYALTPLSSIILSTNIINRTDVSLLQVDSVPHSISLTLYFSAIFHRVFLLIKSFLFGNWLWWHMPLILVEAGHLWVPGQPSYIPRPNLKNKKPTKTSKQTKSPQQNQNEKVSRKVSRQGFREQWGSAETEAVATTHLHGLTLRVDRRVFQSCLQRGCHVSCIDS